ncbi:MAG: hypothetical protein IKK08_12885, partial [Clostridia bacterium]|nr:hypothetical protein [Clostridia bacterium]
YLMSCVMLFMKDLAPFVQFGVATQLYHMSQSFFSFLLLSNMYCSATLSFVAKFAFAIANRRKIFYNKLMHFGANTIPSRIQRLQGAGDHISKEEP